jgi:hypothetical protein
LSERDVPLVFLEGAPGYYSRFGFEPGAAHGFRKPSLRIPDAAFQVLRLPTYESWMTARWCTRRRSGRTMPSGAATRKPEVA